MDVPVTDLDGHSPEIMISSESSRMFPKAGRMKRLRGM